MNVEELNVLAKIVSDRSNSYKNGAALWSFVHHTFMWGAAGLSAAAAAVIQLDKCSWCSEELATILASTSAVMITVSASGAFRRKWQTNRLSRSRFERFEIRMTNPNVDLDKMRDDIEGAIDLHHQVIVGVEEL